MTTLRMNKVIRSDGRIPIKKGLWCPLRTRAGIFTLMQRPTQCEWPSPLIFYIAEARDEDTRRFEVAVGSDGKARATDLLGNN
jgi:hypothetical protein